MLPDNECKECGAAWDWDGDSEQSRVCLSCQLETAQHQADLQLDLEFELESIEGVQPDVR